MLALGANERSSQVGTAPRQELVPVVAENPARDVREARPDEGLDTLPQLLESGPDLGFRSGMPDVPAGAREGPPTVIRTPR